MAGEQNDFLVDARWLAEHRATPDVVLVDTRSATDFRAGHLAGARHFDPFPFHFLDTSARGMEEVRAQLAWIFSALGITGAETLVFYENDSGMRATRTAWLAEYMGHPRVRILDGGLKLANAELTTAVAPGDAQRVRGVATRRDFRLPRIPGRAARPRRRADLRRSHRRRILRRAGARTARGSGARRRTSGLGQQRGPERRVQGAL